MKVYVNRITGIDDAITSMYMSKRTWTRELEKDIRDICNRVLNTYGQPQKEVDESDYKKFQKWMDSLTKWGWQHITILRYIDFSITVEGMHRAGQDDWDAHTQRFNNRIIRSSTRLATFNYELSDYYKEKIIPTDLALKELNISVPESYIHNGQTYVKTVNGYIREDLKDNKDVKRGLYMLSIPSNFTFKINLTEWAHVYKERNKNSGANPEVKECCEMIADQIEAFYPQFNRELFLKIKN